MAHSPGPPAERAANGCRFALYIPKGKSGTTQRRRMGPTVGTITPNDRAAAPAGGAGLLGLLGRQGSGGFLPLWGGPPARFGDFPAVESHAGGWAVPAGAFRGQPPQAALGPRGRSTPGKPASAALGPGWRSAPKLSAGTLQYKPPQVALGPGWRSAPQLCHIAQRRLISLRLPCIFLRAVVN